MIKLIALNPASKQTPEPGAKLSRLSKLKLFMDQVPFGKMLLIIPPCFLNPESDFEIGFPAHLLLLGKVVEEQGWAVEYLDMTLEEKEGNDSFARLEHCLANPAITLAGISNHTVRTSVTTKTVARHIKALRPEIRLVVGGVNATFMWRELLTECQAIDWILRGYAQEGLRKLLSAMRRGGDLSTVPGLASRGEGAFQVQPMAAAAARDFGLRSLNGLPVDRYLEWTTSYPLLTHTGCGFSCNFCTAVMPGPYQSREVYREVADIIAEMRAAIDCGFNRFFMSANIFTSRRERCLELCWAMREAGISEATSWVCMTRVELVDKELLLEMRAAGCTNVAFGVETAGEDQWKALKKGRYREHTVRAAFEACKNVGIGTTVFLMLGSPEQTPDDIEATARLVRELDPDYRVISFFQPFPGTVYWDRQEEYGLSEFAPLEEWNFHESPVCRTRLLSKNDLKRAAVRLHLDRESGRPIDLDRDFLHFLEDASPDNGLDNDPVIVFIQRSCKNLTLYPLLRKLESNFGSRLRLIALYQLSGMIASGAVQMKSTPFQDQEPLPSHA